MNKEKYSKKFLLDLYRAMLRIRLCEESLVAPILSGEIKCPVHLYTGQEAIAVGVCAALQKKDRIFGTHRSHGHYLAKGGSLPRLIAEIFGKETGCSRGRGGSMHIIAPEIGMQGAVPIVGGTISLAVGSALSSRVRGENQVSVAFFGDGAAGEGIIHEALNFAALQRLPVIFVCENNLYSTHMPISKCRPFNNIYETGIPFGIPSHQVPGNDVLKVYQTARKAVAACRKKHGPVLIECLTYRLHGHVGPDDNIQGFHTDIRPKKEVEKWRKKDPVACFESFLLRKKILDRKDPARIRQNLEREVREAHLFAKQSPDPAPKELTRYVFSEK